MHWLASISTTLLLAMTLSAATAGSADAKNGKHGKHHGHGHAYGHLHGLGHLYGPVVPYPAYSSAAIPAPLYAAPAPAAIPHSEWCTQTYQTYDSASDTFLRYDGVRVPCVGP